MKKWCGRRVVALACVAMCLTACAGSGGTPDSNGPSEKRPLIVVSYSILASIVEQLVGDDVQVLTMIPDGTDPHDYAPTAREIEKLSRADLIVRNGGGFDQSLDRVITDAEVGGVRVFTALDHVESPPEGVSGDPHFFTDPESMKQIIDPLADEIASATQVDVSGRATALVAELDNVSAIISADRARLDMDSAGGVDCVLITGHESLGYIASRYDCTILGAVIPGQSSSAGATAADLARLKQLAQGNDVGAIFVESTLSSRVAEQLANELGVAIVTLDVEMLGGNSSYQDYVESLMHSIVEGLIPS